MNLHVTRATDANNGKQNPTHILTPSQSQIQPKGNPPPKVTRIKQNLFKDCALN